jgi:hypothetical protein
VDRRKINELASQILPRRRAGLDSFLYSPAAAGGYVEELLKRSGDPITDDERSKLRERYRWEVVGPNPL